MKMRWLGALAISAMFPIAAGAQAPKAPAGGAVLLENLSWDEAERILTPDAVIVIALGAESKEHGLHLQLNNDFLMAEYFKKRVLGAAPQKTVVAPTINYSFYPAFLEYPGSTTLSRSTAREEIAEIVRSLARYGPRRFYILNTGISTLRPLAEAADELAKDGILLRYTDFTKEDAVEKKLRQSGGTHADEIETSMMLYIASESVRMEKARRDLNPPQAGPLTRDRNGKGTYSPTGASGDPTLATREKGEAVVESWLGSILKDIESLRQTPLPDAVQAPAGWPDELVDHMAGIWELEGAVMGQAAHHEVRAEWVLNHQFLRIEEKTAAAAPKTERSYEAIWFLGYDPVSERYVLHLMDVYGARFSETLGYGIREGNEIRFVFEYPDGPFHTSYRWDSEKGTWEWRMEQKDKNGRWSPFANLKLTKVAGP